MEREFEYETSTMKQKEVEYNGPIVIQEQLEPKPKTIELEIEKELADEVYIFNSSKDIGIKFYDRTPELGSHEAKFVGIPPKGKYITDLRSISPAEWDDSMNVANGTRMVRYKNGPVKVTTIIVPEEKMLEILEKIKKSKDPNRIIIDTRTLNKRLYDEQIMSNKKQPNDMPDDIFIHENDLSSITDFYNTFGNNNIETGKGLK